MSTKLHHGFRFRTNDLGEIHKLIQSFRKKITPIAEAKIARIIANEAVRLFDRATDGRPVGEPARKEDVVQVLTPQRFSAFTML